jgi:polygalacturonase
MLQSNPTAYYTTIKTANTVTSVFDVSGSNYVIVENLDMRGGQGAVVEMSTQHDVVIRNCVIGLESNRQGIRTEHCYNMSIANNTFDTGERNKQDFFSTSDGGGDGINVELWFA